MFFFIFFLLNLQVGLLRVAVSAETAHLYSKDGCSVPLQLRTRKSCLHYALVHKVIHPGKPKYIANTLEVVHGSGLERRATIRVSQYNLEVSRAGVSRNG